MAIHNNILVKFNVGGNNSKPPSPPLPTLAIIPSSGKCLTRIGTSNIPDDDDGNYFIDWNPDCFAALLDLLRTWELYIPSNIPEKLITEKPCSTASSTTSALPNAANLMAADSNFHTP
ncbi:hypothetical protein CsSME_00008076 [Camellia sinensis var. sinensis]